MTDRELAIKLKYNEKMLMEANNRKKDLEELVVVKDYLEQLKLIDEKQKYQLFLSQLEVGEDGTVFAKRRDIMDKSCSNLHFGLSKTLKYALGFIQRFNYDEYYNHSGYFRLLYDDFQKYLDNAMLILNDMSYYEGDRKVENDYGLEIYENPMNYSVVDFRSLIPFDYKQFRMSYHLNSVMPGSNCFVTLDRFYLSDGDLEKLNSREYEAFFGEEAQRILGYSKPKLRKKTNAN